MLVIERLEGKPQLVIKLIGRRRDKFVDQVVKAVGLHNEVRAPEFLSKRIDHVREVFRLRQPAFSKWPHLLEHNL